jgi:Flp pilus assembly CpaE family ATPase
VHDAFADFSQEKRDEVSALLEACDIAPILTTTLDRRIVRWNNLEVWH